MPNMNIEFRKVNKQNGLPEWSYIEVPVPPGHEIKVDYIPKVKPETDIEAATPLNNVKWLPTPAAMEYAATLSRSVMLDPCDMRGAEVFQNTEVRTVTTKTTTTVKIAMAFVAGFIVLTSVCGVLAFLPQTTSVQKYFGAFGFYGGLIASIFLFYEGIYKEFRK